LKTLQPAVRTLQHNVRLQNGEEIDNLKDRIMDQVEENLRDKGVEVNLR
jgi:hypothetical protein